MSKVKIEGNASGTGTFTIAAPNSNTDRSITLPDAAGELLLANGDGSNLTGITVSGPAFAARLSANQTAIHGGAYQKVNFDTEIFDTDSCYDSTTNYRFTPTTAGYYLISLVLNFYTSGSDQNQSTATLYKNGSILAESWGGTGSAYNGRNGASLPVIVYMNGSSDYVEGFYTHWNYTDGANGTIWGSGSYTSLFTGIFIGV